MATDDPEYNIKFVTQLVEHYISSKRFVIDSWSFSTCDSIKMGYQGDYYGLSVKFIRNDEMQEIFLFVKTLPKDKKKAKKLLEVGYFKREYGVYTEILETFDRIHRNNTYHPRLALSSPIEIVLENLTKKEYYVRCPRTALDIDHCKTAINSLVAFHTASFVYEHIYKTKVEEDFRNILKECGYVYSGWYEVGINAAITIASMSKKHQTTLSNINYLKKFKKLFLNVLEMCRPSEVYKNVVCHRDLWSNNLMFLYNDNIDPIHCVMVDYQAAICMPPAGDVVSLIYLNLERKERQNLFEQLTKYYYDRLEEELLEHHLCIEDVYMDFGKYMMNCELYRIWGLVQAILLHQLALLKPEDKECLKDNENYDYILNISRNTLVHNTMQKDPLYKKRMLDNVEEFLERYVVNTN